MAFYRKISCGSLAILGIVLGLDATQAQMQSGACSPSAASLWLVHAEVQATSCHAASRPLSVLSLFSPRFTEYSQEQKQKIALMVDGLRNVLCDQSLYKRIKELQDASVNDTNIKRYTPDSEAERKRNTEAFEKEVAAVQQDLTNADGDAQATKQNIEKLFLQYVLAASNGDRRAREEACRLVRSGELQEYFEEQLGSTAAEHRLRVYVKLLTNNVTLGEGDSCPICKKDFEKNDPIHVTNPCLHIFCKSCIQGWKDLGKHSCPVCRGLMFSASRRTYPSHLHLRNALH